MTWNACRSCGGCDASVSPAEIARRLGPASLRQCVVNSERNSNPDGDYHALMAHARATERARRTKAVQT